MSDMHDRHPPHREFDVHVTPHGRHVRAREDRPVLEAALDAGLNLPHSCKSGHCSSCRARLLSGSIRYPGPRPLGLTEEEERNGYVLLCQARPRSDLTVEARFVARASDAEIKTLPCRIASLRKLSWDVMQVLLRLPAVEPLSFQAGQYVDVLIEGGRRRSFSIASPPHEPGQIELHVRHVPGGGFTERVFHELGEGALLRIEGPLGQFVYRESSGPAIFVAGGTGFAPLKSMLRHLFESGGERDIHLYWGARTAADVYEEDLVLEWTRQHPKLRFTAVLSGASSVERPHHRTGWVHEAVLADYPQLAPYEVYAAGPPALVEAIRATYPRHGLAPERLHFDSFDYAPDSLNPATE